MRNECNDGLGSDNGSPHFRQALNGIIDELYEMYKKNGADLNKEVLPVKKEGISLRELDFLS